MHDLRGTYDVADRGDVERNENAICVYPRAQYCVCESCWRRFTHVLVNRACAYSCNGLRAPSSSPPLLSSFYLLLTYLSFDTRVCLFLLCFSAFFATYIPLLLLSPLSLSLVLRSIFVGRPIFLHIYVLLRFPLLLLLPLFFLLLLLLLLLPLLVLRPRRSSSPTYFLWLSLCKLATPVVSFLSVCVPFCARLRRRSPLSPPWQSYHVYSVSCAPVALPLIVTCVPPRNVPADNQSNAYHVLTESRTYSRFLL